jgi:phage terminase large subunit
MAIRSKSSISTKTTKSFELTDKQKELRRLLGGPQRHTLVVGGGRSGKTFLIVRSIMARALAAPGSRHAILRLRFNAVRSSIWLDTLPKVARLCFPEVEVVDKRQDGYVLLPETGSEIWMGGLDEKQRVEKILGQEYATIYFCECSQIPYSSVVIARTRLAQSCTTVKGAELPIRAYYDLNPVGTGHWTHRQFVQHRDPVSLKKLENPEQYAHAFMNPEDNKANLPAATLEEYRSLPERQRRDFTKAFIKPRSTALCGHSRASSTRAARRKMCQRI